MVIPLLPRLPGSIPSKMSAFTMVLILDGNSEIVAHVRSKHCYLICLRHLIRSRTVTNRIVFSPKRRIFLHACATCSELPSTLSPMPYTRQAKVTKSHESLMWRQINRTVIINVNQNHHRSLGQLIYFIYFQKQGKA